MKSLILLTSLLSTLAFAGTGKASWYGPGFDGKRTASGAIFRQHGLTTACHPGIRLGAKLKVTNLANGKSVNVVCNDRGAFHSAKYGNRVLDLSKGAFSKIASTSTGVIRVKYEILK